MIKEIEIQNFQSHKNTTLEFDEGVNVIVGTSDSGKSAILRTLHWVIYNRPSGDSIRSWWGGRTSVKATFDNGIIERVKDKSDEYIINDKTSLKAFGLSVPEDVIKVLNFADVNIQKQMDKPFLLDNSPGEVASYFNDVAGLSKIDRSLQYVEKEIRTLTSDIKYKKAEQEKLIEQLAKFNYLEKYEIELEVLEEMSERKIIQIRNMNKLIGHYNTIVKIEGEIEEAASILQDEDYVNKLVIDIGVRDGKIVERKKLQNIISSNQNLLEEIESYEMAISIEPLVNKITDKLEERKTVSNQFTSLNKLLNSLNDITTSIDTSNRNLDLQIAQFKKEMPSICPLCGSKN